MEAEAKSNLSRNERRQWGGVTELISKFQPEAEAEEPWLLFRFIQHLPIVFNSQNSGNLNLNPGEQCPGFGLCL